MDHATPQKLFTSMMKEYGVNHITTPVLSAIQWIGRKFFPNCQELVLQHKGSGKRSFQMSKSIPQYSLFKQYTITDANLTKQACKIRSPLVKCCKKTTWFRLRVT